MYVCVGASSGGLVRWKGKVIRLAPLQNLMWWGSRHWLLLIVIITFRFSVFTVDGSGRRQATGGSRCRWAGQCNDSGRRRSLVLRLHRNPPLGGGHYERLTLSLLSNFWATNSRPSHRLSLRQDFSLFRDISAIDSAGGRCHMAASVECTRRGHRTSAHRVLGQSHMATWHQTPDNRNYND